MTSYDIDLTVRARDARPMTPWLPCRVTVAAADAADARRQALNHLALAGLDYGTLDMTLDPRSSSTHAQ